MPSSSRQATPRRSRTSELLTARPLTAGEVALARHVFGEAIDYARATIARGKWAFFQPRRVVMAPSGCIHFHPRGTLYRDDFADAALTDQGLFIPEMPHLRQLGSASCRNKLGSPVAPSATALSFNKNNN